MLDVVVINGQCKGIVTRNLVTGKIESFAGDAVLLCTGGYGNVFFLSTNAKNSNVTAAWRAHKRGAAFANPCYTQIHPTCIPVHGEYQSKLTLMSESLRNDGRVWVPTTPATSETPIRFLKPSETTSSNASTPVSATSRRVISLHAAPRKLATPAWAWGQVV